MLLFFIEIPKGENGTKRELAGQIIKLSLHHATHTFTVMFLSLTLDRNKVIFSRLHLRQLNSKWNSYMAHTWMKISLS